MKKRPVLHQLASICIAASVFFSATSLAHAETLTVPQQFRIPGLTFLNNDPTSYISPLAMAEPTGILFITPTSTQVTPTSTSKNKKKQYSSHLLLQPTPTIYIAPAHVQTIINTPTPTPTTKPLASTVTPPPYTPAPQVASNGSMADQLFSMVNSYRQSKGLPAFQQDSRSCNLAQQRAPMIAGEIASGTMHSGLRAMNLPYWNTENIISMNSAAAAFNWWINDPIHHDAIVGNFTYSCVACSGNSCAEEFTNYQPK